jgi:hypothetical protein
MASETLFLRCPVCAGDRAETLGVTGSSAVAADASVVMRCASCAAVYLTPAPRTVVGDESTDAGTARRAAARWAAPAAGADRTLTVEDAASLPASGQYQELVLLHTLESAADPAGLLGKAARLVTDGGRILVVTANPGSSCFGIFGGRHWSGYARAGARQQLAPGSLRHLADVAGLRLARTATAYDSAAWLHSTRRWLRDWQAKPWLVALLTGRWLAPQAVAALLESVAQLRGRGNLLVGEMTRR